jgi:hypothetical protein
MTNTQIFELVLAALPYCNQITDIDFHGTEVVRFTWRGARFQISSTLQVEEVEDGMLLSTDKTILLRALLERANLVKGL